MTPRDLASTYGSRIITRRWQATIVDFVVLLFLGAVIGGLWGGGYSSAKGAILFAGIPLLYYVVLEMATGRTLGKFVTGIIVVNEGGERPALLPAVIRTATRLLEVNPVLLGGIPAGIIANSSAAKQRLGDMLAHTYVIFTRDLPQLTGEPMIRPQETKAVNLESTDWLSRSDRS
jgi:uncharacterized RDD family membrane protein YckC